MEDPEFITLRNRLSKLQRMFAILGVLLISFFALVCVRIGFVIPKFERIFADMLGDTPLPWITQMVIGLPYLFFGLGYPILTAVLPAGVIIFLLRNREKPIAWGLTVSTIVFLKILIFVIPTALFMPLMTMITEMNGGI